MTFVIIEILYKKPDKQPYAVWDLEVSGGGTWDIKSKQFKMKWFIVNLNSSIIILPR